MQLDWLRGVYNYNIMQDNFCRFTPPHFLPDKCANILPSFYTHMVIMQEKKVENEGGTG